jgi:mono/diheme cytochrome c family protein
MTFFAILLMLIVSAWSTPAPAQSPAAGPNAAPQGNVENGKKLYVQRGCWTCHGYAAQGGALNPNPTGPRLAGRTAPFPAFSRYIRHPTGNMVPYTEKILPDKELADIHAWLRSIPPPPAVSSIPLLKD